MHRFISKIDLFANIEEVYSDIARVMTFRQFPPFEELCKQGTTPDGFYAVVSGSLELTLEYVGGEHQNGKSCDDWLQVHPASHTLSHLPTSTYRSDTEGPMLPGAEPEKIELSEEGGGPVSRPRPLSLLLSSTSSQYLNPSALAAAGRTYQRAGDFRRGFDPVPECRGHGNC